MSTATIEKGSEVETVIKGEVTGQDSAGRNIVITKEGASVTIPADASTYVTKKPLPVQPKANSLVQYSSAVFKRDVYKNWYRIDQKETDRYGDRTYYTWKDLNDLYGRGNLTRLVKDTTAGYADLTDKPMNFGTGGVYGKFQAVMGKDGWGDPELTVNCPASACSVKVDRGEARDLAFAILKATGGL